MPITAAIMKRRLCRFNSDNCARYLVFAALGSEMVPISLYPNQLERAREIIDTARNITSEA